MPLYYIFKKSLSLFTFELMIGVANFLVAIILARKLGVEDFGVWGLTILLLGYGEAFGRIKVDLASVFIMSEKKYSPQKIISSVNFITLLSTLIILIIFICFSNLILEILFKESSTKISKSIYIISIVFFLQNYFFNYLYINLALQRTDIFGFYNMMRSILFLIILLFLIALNILNLENILIGLAFSFFLVLTVMFVEFHLKYGIITLPNLDLSFSLLKRGSNYYILGIFSQMNFSIVLIVASQYLTATNVGIFYTARSLSDLIYSRLASAGSGILYPLISNMRGSIKEKKSIVFEVFIRTIFIFFVFYLILFFNWDLLITFLYGSQYSRASEIMNYLGIGSFVYFVTALLMEYLKGTGNEIFTVVPHLVSIIFQVIIITFFLTNLSLISLSFLHLFSLVICSLTLLTIFLLHK